MSSTAFVKWFVLLLTVDIPYTEGHIKVDNVIPDYPSNWQTETERAQNQWKEDQRKWFDYIFDPHYDVSTHDLYYGTEIPVIGMNTQNNPKLFDSLVFGLRLGFRFFHASLASNNHEHIARAISTVGVHRSSIYLSISIQPEFYGYASVITRLTSLVKQMEFKNIDLCLMDSPKVILDNEARSASDAVYESAKIRRLTWMALEALQEDGICSNLGVSHFEKEHIVEIMSFAKHKPTVNMIEFHPYHLREALRKYMIQERMIVVSENVLYPIGDGTLLRDNVIREIARKYAKTPSQIVLKWAMQQGIVALFNDEEKQRIADHGQTLGFELEYNDIYDINQMNKNEIYSTSFDEVESIQWNKTLEKLFLVTFAEHYGQLQNEQIEKFKAFKRSMHKQEL